MPKHTRRVLECVRSVLDFKTCFFVGQIIDARWVWDEAEQWFPAEVLHVEIAPSGITYYYVHYLERPKKDDDWLPSHQVRQLTDLDSLSALVDGTFFQLSQLSKQTTAGSSAYGSSAHHDPHEYSPKTIRGINFGGTPIRAWYRSPFPRSVWSMAETFLPLCSTCLYYGDAPHVCDRQGLCEVYAKDDLVIYQVEGAESSNFCERLFLLAKLFLEDKRTSTDDSSQTTQVMSFLFYVLMEKGKFVGYFSKYKMQKKDSPILSCILVLPSQQRKGFGSLLISVAYELAKREGRPPGSAERPLSGPGYFAFQSWWTWRMRSVLAKCYDGETLSIAQLGELAGMTSEDVVDSLRHCGALKHWGAGEVKLRESGKRAKIQLNMDMFRALESKEPRNAFDPSKLNEFVRLCPILQTPKH